MFNKELEDLKNKKMNNTITEMENTLEEINSRINEVEEWISVLEDRLVEIIAVNQNKEWKESEDNLRDLWDNIKCTDIHIIEIPKREEKALENIWRNNNPKLP